MEKLQRERKVLKAVVRLESCLDNRAEITLKVPVRVHLVLIGTPWFGEKCSYASRHVEEQPRKKPKRMVTVVLWLCWKIHDTWVAYHAGENDYSHKSFKHSETFLFCKYLQLQMLQKFLIPKTLNLHGIADIPDLLRHVQDHGRYPSCTFASIHFSITLKLSRSRSVVGAWV